MEKQNVHILKSISIIMCIVFFVYVIPGFFTQSIYALLQLSPEGQLCYYMRYIDVVYIASAINGPVLYAFRFFILFFKIFTIFCPF